MTLSAIVFCSLTHERLGCNSSIFAALFGVFFTEYSVVKSYSQCSQSFQMGKVVSFTVHFLTTLLHTHTHTHTPLFYLIPNKHNSDTHMHLESVSQLPRRSVTSALFYIYVDEKSKQGGVKWGAGAGAWHCHVARGCGTGRIVPSITGISFPSTGGEEGTENEEGKGEA